MNEHGDMGVFRKMVSDGAKGQVVHSLEWSEDADGSNGYWVMTFESGAEICFDRTMAEKARGW